MIKIGKSTDHISFYSCQPKTDEELDHIIKKRILDEGSECDLNDIDTSLITDMSYLFYESEFNGDISRWNVSKVESMESMFEKSSFNGDIYSWDVSKVKDMRWMFEYSDFNQDIYDWNINEDCDTNCMFDNCPIREEFKPKSLQNK